MTARRSSFRGLAALFVVPRLGPPELALSAAGAVADDVGIPRRRRLSLSIPARVPWYSGIPRSAASCTPDSLCAARPNRPRARYLSRYPTSTPQRFIAFAGRCSTERGSTLSRTARASPAPSLGRRRGLSPSPAPCFTGHAGAQCAKRWRSGIRNFSPFRIRLSAKRYARITHN